MTGPLAGSRILVVEDEMLLVMHIESTLSDLGCTDMSSASSSADALALLASRSFDAAMLDVNLDGEKSYAVADVLIARGIPILFATGSADHGDRRDLLAFPVLRKPYRTSELAAALELLLTGRVH